MSLKQKIIHFLAQKSISVKIQEIYDAFPEVAKTTVRGRVYDSLGKGIVRVDKGLYISSKAIVEYGDSLQIIDRLVQDNELFDFIFLDIPYAANGQKGGNRDLFALDKITPDQFEVFINKCVKLLKTDDSPLAFMFTSGTTSKKAHDNYLSKIPLKRHPKIGTYQKMWSTGNPMNIGKYIMPKENIYLFSKSGHINFNQPNLDFALVPNLKEYPTAKPLSMIKKIVETFTNAGNWVLDPFGGSGKTLEACVSLGRYCHIIDSSETSFVEHLIPKMI